MSHHYEEHYDTGPAAPVPKTAPRFTLHFACGATYGVDAPAPRNKVGNLAGLLVYVQGRKETESPKRDGQAMSCLHGCPATVRASKRKEQRAWVGDAAIQPVGEPVRCVICTPVRVTDRLGAKPT